MNKIVRILLCVTLLPLAACNAQFSDFRQVAESFIDKQYKAQTLEVPGEPLVVNLDGVDCTTFVEYVVAAMISGREPAANDAEFCKALEQLRYRDGVRNGYLSRLHYSSDWIGNNVKMGILDEVTDEYSTTMGMKRLDFMTTHYPSYPALSADRALIEELRVIEDSISNEPYYYIPAHKVPEVAHKLNDGDIVLFMTAIEGLDFTHMGFVYKEDGHTKLLHASTRYNKVCVDPDFLADYVINNRRCTGIRVMRVK